MSKPNIVAVSGGLSTPSKTTTLVTTIASAAAEHLGSSLTLIELGPIAAVLGGTLRRDQATPDISQALTTAEHADLLVVGTPVYRGSFAGHFKLFFDLVERTALRGVPVILAATGGGDSHSLVIEHSLRPLFAFFEAFALPTGIYASDRDFEAGELRSPHLTPRIQAAVREAAGLLLATSNARL